MVGKKKKGVAEFEEEAENRVGLLLCFVCDDDEAGQPDRPEAEKGTADRLAACSLECAATHHSCCESDEIE